MPIYEYRCPKCSHEYEKREGFGAPAVQKCPSCGGRARRVIQAPPIVFKGSGFYVTDSRKPAPAESDGSTSGTTPKASEATAKQDGTSSNKDTEAAAAG